MVTMADRLLDTWPFPGGPETRLSEVQSTPDLPVSGAAPEHGTSPVTGLRARAHVCLYLCSMATGLAQPPCNCGLFLSPGYVHVPEEPQPSSSGCSGSAPQEMADSSHPPLSSAVRLSHCARGLPGFFSSRVSISLLPLHEISRSSCLTSVGSLVLVAGL